MSKRAWMLAFLSALLLRGASAHAFFDTGLRQTIGSDSYRGLYGFLDFGGDWHLKPSFNLYRSDFSSGTYRTFSLRLAYDRPSWGFGVYAGGTPNTNDYSNWFVGGDTVLSLISRKKDGDRDSFLGMSRLDVGAGIDHITHTNGRDFLNVRRSTTTPSVSVGETDLNVNIGTAFFGVDLSGSFTKALYDRNSNDLSTLVDQTFQLTGTALVVSGFPNYIANARLQLNFLPVIYPYVSYTHTQFMVVQPDSNAYIAGVKARIGFLEPNVSYERYVQRGQPTLGYSTVGLTARF